jgi:hypothetical protein
MTCEACFHEVVGDVLRVRGCRAVPEKQLGEIASRQLRVDHDVFGVDRQKALRESGDMLW